MKKGRVIKLFFSLSGPLVTLGYVLKPRDITIETIRRKEKHPVTGNIYPELDMDEIIRRTKESLIKTGRVNYNV